MTMTDDEQAPETKAPADENPRDDRSAPEAPSDAKPAAPQATQVGKVTPKPHVRE
jgi:hypothetical protein